VLFSSLLFLGRVLFYFCCVDAREEDEAGVEYRERGDGIVVVVDA